MRHLKIYEHLIHTFSQEDLDDIIDIFQDIVDEYSLYKIGDLLSIVIKYFFLIVIH